jgi:hypothetical protein
MVPRGANISDMNARMAAAYASRRGEASVQGIGVAAVMNPTTGQAWPGGLLYPGDHSILMVQVQGTFTATITIEGSQDNTVFQTLIPDSVPAGTDSQGAISAPGVYRFLGNYRSVRVNGTAYTSGVATVLLESTRG